MRSFTRATFLLGLTAAFACSDQATAPDMANPAIVRAARAPSIPTVRLTVTISDRNGLEVPYNIRSDANGAYSDGLDGVQAILDGSGTFAFNTQANAKRNAIRWVSYDFNNPIDPSNTYRPSPSNLKNYHFSTGPSAFSPFIPIQNLGMNGNPSSECVYMGNSMANATTTWRVSFHKGMEDVSSSATAFAVVTRTSVTPAIWTITPVGSCSPNANVAALRSDNGTILYGYYNLPFLFTLRAK